jgi:hypothetical protein
MRSDDNKPTPLEDDDDFDFTPKVPPPDEDRIMKYFAAKQKLKDDFAAGYFKDTKLPLTEAQSDALDTADRKMLEERETKWIAYNIQFPENVSDFPSKDALHEIALGKQVCPVCAGKLNVGCRVRGAVTGVTHNSVFTCTCRLPSVIQRWLDQLVREEYRECDLKTLKPSNRSSLALSRQAEEIEILKKASADNYFFIGPPGASKSTFATALLRESLWRNKQWGENHSFFSNPWFCWKVNAEKLFVQNMAWKTSMTDETPAPAPDVTPEKIDRVRASGLRPTLIIEELDKTKLTDSRVNFLFEIVDAMDGCKGQIIITSNRTLDRFMAMFEEHPDETVRVTGGPLMRRFLKNCNVRNYFK